MKLRVLALALLGLTLSVSAAEAGNKGGGGFHHRWHGGGFHGGGGFHFRGGIRFNGGFNGGYYVRRKVIVHRRYFTGYLPPPPAYYPPPPGYYMPPPPYFCPPPPPPPCGCGYGYAY